MQPKQKAKSLSMFQVNLPLLRLSISCGWKGCQGSRMEKTK